MIAWLAASSARTLSSSGRWESFSPYFSAYFLRVDSARKEIFMSKPTETEKLLAWILSQPAPKKGSK